MKKFGVVLFLLGVSFLCSYSQVKPQWITSVDNQNSTNTWICFQKNINLRTLPEKAMTRIAADSKYWLWINGKVVVIEGSVKRGPTPNDTYFDQIDIAPYLKTGNNLISILTWYYGRVGFSYNPSGQAALFFDCRFKNVSIVSDASWKARLHPSYFTPEQPLPNFRLPESNIGYDARKDINGWELKYNKQWSAVKTIGKEGDAPWNKLYHRVIPMWKDYGLRGYVKQTIRKGEMCDTLVCRLPYDAQVMPSMKVEAEAGKTITMVSNTYRAGGAKVLNIRAEYVTKSGVQQYENKGWISGEEMYYIYPKGVKILNAQYRETGYDTEFEGYFHCSDDFLNRFYEKACRTLYVTMRDNYMDCPDRERAQWWGDEVNESGEAFYTLSTSSHLLMKKGMYELINWQRPDGILMAPIPESNHKNELCGQMLAAIGYYGFWNYYLNTGDLHTIRDLYPGVKRYMSIWKLNDNGTLKPREIKGPWGDWGTNVDRQAIFDCFYYMALKGQCLMAKALGLNDDVVAISEKMRNYKIAFNKVLWNGKEYRYEGYQEDTDDRVQALAVVSGLADKEKYPAILEILKHSEYASPYMEKYVMESLFMMGYEEYGIERMKKRYACMVNDTFHSTLFESWDLGKDGLLGPNHAWSGGPLTILNQYLCGVSPIVPGYKEFAVCPQPANIRQAETKIPTVNGNIKVSYENNADQFILNIVSSQSAAVIVYLPVSAKSVMMNGKLIWVKEKFCGNASKVEFLKKDDVHLSFRVKGSVHYCFIAAK